MGSGSEYYGVLLRYNANGILERKVTVEHPPLNYYADLEIVSDGIVGFDKFFCTFWNFSGGHQWSSYYRAFTSDSDNNFFTTESFRTERGNRFQFKKMFIGNTSGSNADYRMIFIGD